MNFRNILQAIARRGVLILSSLIIAFGVLLVWFLVSGFSPSTVQVSIGIAAISAFLAALSSISNLLQAVETERQRRNQERPYVNAYFDTSGNNLVNFIVQNSWNAPAINVKLGIEPAPVDFSGRKLSEVSFFSRPISFLPVGKNIRQMVGVGYEFLADDRPLNFNIEVEYSSSYGDIFKEKLNQNLEYLRQNTIPGKSIEEILTEIGKTLKEFNSVVKKVERLGAIQIETPQQSQQRYEQMIEDGKNLSWLRKKARTLLIKILRRV